jgi:hypothetical protein
MKMKRFLFMATMVALLCALPHGAAADEHEAPPTYLTVHYDRIDPAKVADFEANGRMWVETFKELGMGAEYGWTGYSGPNFTYAWVSSMPNFAYLDDSPARMKAVSEAVGEEKMAELIAQPGLLSHHTEVLKEEPTLSYFPEGFSLPTSGVGHVGVHHVRPGMEEAFTELVGKVVAAYKQVESPMGFAGHRVAFGEGSFLFVSFAESLGAFYSGPNTGAVLAEAYGPEVAQEIFAKWGECISGYETSDWQLRGDLSYVPGAGGSEEGEDGDSAEGGEVDE